MDIDYLSKSRFGVGLALALGRVIPSACGYPLAGWAANQLAKRKKSPMVQAVRLNQWVIRGRISSPDELDLAVHAVFQHAGRCMFDLYHNISNPVRIREFFRETAEIRGLVQRSLKREKGAFLVTSHLSNFDLALLSLGQRGLDAQVLSYSEPSAGYQVQNQLRTQASLKVAPISPYTLRQAIRRMRDGGLVITGIDRPVDKQGIELSFFGRPARLPTGHVRMALAADVPIIVAVPSIRPDGEYQLFISEPLPMRRLSDPKEEIRVNAEAILKIVEGCVRQNPEQWLMYYPVWPDLLDEMNRQS